MQYSVIYRGIKGSIRDAAIINAPIHQPLRSIILLPG